MGDVVQDPRDHPAPDDEHDDDEGANLGDRDRQRGGDLRHLEAGAGSVLQAAVQDRHQRRQQHQRQHHDEVFDDQPADGDAPALGVEDAALLQRAQQHHGAGDRQREAEGDAGAERPAEPIAKPDAEHRRDGDLHDGAGHRDQAHRPQVFQREMQADAEHQQDDADLGQLAGQRLIGDEAGRIGPERYAGEQVADERRYADALRDGAENEGEAEPHDDGGDERGVVRHASGRLIQVEAP